MLQRSSGALILALALSAVATPAQASLLKLRPGPIERPLHLASADFDRDGCQDLAIADFEAGTVTLLVNRLNTATATCTGDFVPHIDSPLGVGIATIGSPTTGPIHLEVVDLNREDVDSDGVPNVQDDCPNFPNPPDTTTGLQIDVNGNGIGDACEILDANGNTLDSDGDGIPDYDPITATLDNCPRTPNPLQQDAETAAGTDGMCGTSDDNPLLSGPDGTCGTPDDLIGDRIGDGCADSPDLLVLDSSSGFGSPIGAIVVRLNDGSGRMVSRAAKFTGFAPAEIVSKDFNGDANLDIAVSNTRDDDLQFFPGEGDGAFGPAQLIPAGHGPQGMAAADFDGDGDFDLAVANRQDHTIGVYLNSGAGLPGAASALLQTENQPTVLVSGRLDSDAFADLIVLVQDTQDCVGGTLAGNSCSSDEDCKDPADPTMNGSCKPRGTGFGAIQEFKGSAGGLASTPAATVTLGADRLPRAAVLIDLNGDGKADRLAVADFTGGQVLLYSVAADGSLSGIGSLGCVTEPSALAVLDLDPQDPGGPDPDLAVLDFGRNRVDLFKNMSGFSCPAPPAFPELASPWKDTSAMALFGADAFSGADAVLLQRADRRIDVLSGIGNGFFRPTPFVALPEPGRADGMVVADFRDDDRPDLVVLDGAGSKLTMVLNRPTGALEEAGTIALADPPARGASGTLITDLDDIDRDGVPNALDNCPTVYNPPFCRVTDAACAAEVPCTDAVQVPTDCDPSKPMTLDPRTQQCDSDRNGIGDQCQILNLFCAPVDADGDQRPEYDPTALFRTGASLDFDRDGVPNFLDSDNDGVPEAFDNCPTTANPDQRDLNGNRIGDACETQPVCSNRQTLLCSVDSECSFCRDDVTRSCSTTCSNDPTRTCDSASDCPPGGTCLDLDCPNSFCEKGKCDYPDTDGDGKKDFDPLRIDPLLLAWDQVAAALDDCPAVPNPSVCSNAVAMLCATSADCPRFCSNAPSQVCAGDPDCPGGTCVPGACRQPDNDGDNVGNACVRALALDNCPTRANGDQAGVRSAAGLDRACGTADDLPMLKGPDGQCGTTDDVQYSDGVGNVCDVAPVDLVTVSPASGKVALLTGDGSGNLREAAFSPIAGFTTPSAALLGNLSLVCTVGLGCTQRTASDLLVAEQVAPGNTADDLLTVLIGDGRGAFTERTSTPTQGDPAALLLAPAQPACPIPPYPGQPDSGLRFDIDVRTDLVVVVQPGTSSLGIALASNLHTLSPSLSPLVPPPAHGAPLPVPGALVDATLADMNQDGLLDIVALSSGDGDPTTPDLNVTIYIGMGNGLFFSDPTLNPTDVPDGGTLLGTTNAHLQTEVFLPDVIVFNAIDAAPWVLTNVLNERADIDGSRRADGFDLALLARAFGQSRGEDFTLVASGGLLTLQQSGSGYASVVTGTGTRTAGQDLPDSALTCTRALETVGPRYGLAVDINLDGIVDGKDLAILASRFGSRF